MPTQPTLADVMDTLRDIHGDVKVALDRTEKHDERLKHVETTQTNQGLEMARAKGMATVVGGFVALAVSLVIESLKAAFNSGSHSG